MAETSESIYSWIKVLPPPPSKPAMYHSKVSPHMPLAATTFTETARKKPVGVIGREVKTSVKPQTFLKAGEKTGTLIATMSKTVVAGSYEAPAATRRSQSNSRKPAVPRRDEMPVLGLSTGKNFVESNAVAAILAPIRARVKRPEPEWLKKPGYGQIPDYLTEMRQAIEEERQFLEELLKQQETEEKARAPGMRELTAEERHALLSQLKHKWDEVNKAYQRITFKNISGNSSLNERRWKENCETQLTQLEKDIQKLSVKAAIYVVDN